MTINTTTVSEIIDSQQFFHLAEVILKSPNAGSIVVVLFSLYIVYQIMKKALDR